MLTGDGNEKCNKKSTGLKSEKKKVCTCSTFFCTFLCHCFARLQRTWNVLVARFMEKKSYMFPCSIFVSLPLILTLLAANICHFLIAALNFFYVFFLPQWTSSAFFFSFCFVLSVSLQLFLCYRCQCNGSRGKQSNARSRDYEIFSNLTGYHFFFARERASLILILYYGKWLIINSAIFSNSCPVIAEMHILN